LRRCDGRAFVLANIRGGGEFEPAWHDAALKTHRQVAYDDFAAVARDVIARKITSSRCFGIFSDSNGGLLMGVEMTQHPDLWNAVVIEVPLLDMLHYEKLSAGSSWIGEYGSMSVDAERAFWERVSPYHALKADAPLPRALHLDYDEGRPRGPRPGAQVRREDEDLGPALPLLGEYRGRSRSWREFEGTGASRGA
jgi:prolyl oligopeptidase